MVALNSKVEHSQKTDLEGFYPTVDLQDSELRQKPRDGQDFYEFRRAFLSVTKCRGKSGMSWRNKTLYYDKVEVAYDE